MRTIFVLLLFAGVAFAHPPEHQHYQWFREQHNQKGQWCCNESDGHSLLDNEWRIRNGVYQFKVDNVWIDVPPERLIKDGKPNPTGMAAVWYMKINGAIHLYCFAPGPLF